MRRVYRVLSTYVLALLCTALALPGCSDPEKEIGSRWSQLQKVVAAVQGKPEGQYSASDVPADVRPRGLSRVYVDGRGVCALEFVSEVTVDLNPAFVFVGFDAPDPEAVAVGSMRQGGRSPTAMRSRNQNGIAPPANTPRPNRLLHRASHVSSFPLLASLCFSRAITARPGRRASCSAAERSRPEVSR